MPLTNEQFQALSRIYDERQAKNRAEHERRYDEVLERIPEYAGLEQRISQNALKLAARGIQGKMGAEDMGRMLEEENRPLMEEKKKLLALNGFPEDYLLPIYTCPDCRDTGFIKNENGLPEKCRCYHKLAAEITFEGLQNAGIPTEADFENFAYEYYPDKKIDENSELSPRKNIEAVTGYFKKYINNYPDIYANHLIYGDVGVGKTYLSYCIINELKKRAFPYMYLTAYEFFELASENTFTSHNSPEKAGAKQKFNEALNAELLVIDDLGSGLCNAFTTSQMFLCINERQLKRKPTIITSNLSLEDLKQNYGERIFSRIIGDYTLIKIYGDDIRLKSIR